MTAAPTPVPAEAPLLSVQGLGKSFGPVAVLQDIAFEVRPGEVHAVIGENGAGKSTLMKILAGHLAPSAGTLAMNGAPLRLAGPVDAERHGIVLVHQEILLAPHLTVAENLFLGREAKRSGLLGWIGALDKKRMLAEATRHMQMLKIGIRSMKQAVETLSGGQRQGVAVARSAAFARHVVIMDEPTAALGVKESNMVLDLIRRVRERGLPVILISHNMPHVFEIADRIHIARLGKRACVVNPKHISMSDTVAVMTGAKRPEELPPQALA